MIGRLWYYLTVDPSKPLAPYTVDTRSPSNQVDYELKARQIKDLHRYQTKKLNHDRQTVPNIVY